MVIPISAVWQNSKAKKRLDEIDRKLIVSKRESENGGRKRTGKDISNANNGKNKWAKTGDKSGWIKCTGANLSLPTRLFNKDYKTCKASA